MSWAVTRTRLSALRTLPSSTVATPSFWPMLRRSSALPLKDADEVRPATCSPSTCASALEPGGQGDHHVRQHGVGPEEPVHHGLDHLEHGECGMAYPTNARKTRRRFSSSNRGRDTAGIPSRGPLRPAP
jgi:hypothetical protein